MEHEPLVSIILPTYNRAEYLRQAVESVRHQTYRNWELIVVDDGSTDGSPEQIAAIRDARLRLIRISRSGNPARVRNAGIADARGAYVAFLDSDDLWMPDKLARQLQDLVRRRDCRWSYTYFKPVGSAGSELPLPTGAKWHPARGWIFGELIGGTAWVATPSVVVERALLQEVGGFDESYLFSEDYELWIRLARRSPVALLPEPLVAVRWHEGRRREALVFTYGVEMYRRLLASGQLGDARALCRRRWVLASIELADRWRWEGRYARAFLRLGSVLPYGLVRKRWWISLAKAAVRPLVPQRLLTVYRRARGSVASV